MSDATTTALQFVEAAELPEAPAARFGFERSAEVALDEARDQAAVVGSEIISFVRGVSRERRRDIVNASLFAQLIAKKKVAEPANLEEIAAWYNSYFDVLAHLGFSIWNARRVETRPGLVLQVPKQRRHIQPLLRTTHDRA